MATVRPFRGIVFEPTRINDLADVTCPPYDVISPAERTELYDRHPFNIVRIISGREEDADRPGTDDKYTRAAGFFRSWLWEGVLREDDQPSMYVYRQAFTDPSGRFRRVWGVVATISLDDEILAHEQTMAGPKADRLALMNAIPANLSPIYALYKAGEGAEDLGDALREVAGHAPVADFVDDEATRHTVWVRHEEKFHRRVAECLAPSPILIADGHHRFETARGYRASATDDRAGQIMTLLVDAGAEPMCILPYHRIVLRCGGKDILGTLQESFEVEPLGKCTVERAEQLGMAMWDRTPDAMFVAFVGDEAFRLRTSEVASDEIPAGILKRLALEPLGAEFAEGSLAFTPRPRDVFEASASGEARVGFLIQPVDVARVWTLAASGAKMPEKSTYFHPKPRDGIVMRRLADAD